MVQVIEHDMTHLGWSFVSRVAGDADSAAVDTSGGGRASSRGWRRRRGACGGIRRGPTRRSPPWRPPSKVAAVRSARGPDRPHECRRRRRGEHVVAAGDGGVGRPRRHADWGARGRYRGCRRRRRHHGRASLRACRRRGGRRVSGGARRQRPPRRPHRRRVRHWRVCRPQPVGAGRHGPPGGGCRHTTAAPVVMPLPPPADGAASRLPQPPPRPPLSPSVLVYRPRRWRPPCASPPAAWNPPKPLSSRRRRAFEVGHGRGCAGGGRSGRGGARRRRGGRPPG